jgi:hypothetical protein
LVFNNDPNGDAVRNADRLTDLLAGRAVTLDVARRSA